jgi:hypothetical protein
VAENVLGQNNPAVGFSTAARLFLNLLRESPKDWEHVNLSLNDYDTDSIEICSIFWLPDITDRWRQHEEMHPKYNNVPIIPYNITYIIPHGVGVEAGCSLGRDVIGWRQSKTTCESLHGNVVLKQFADATHGILAGDDPPLDTMDAANACELKR